MFSKLLLILIPFLLAMNAFGQTPPIGPGVSHDLAIWRAAHYSDVRYKLNLTLEKMSPVLKGTIEIRVNVSTLPRGTSGPGGMTPSNTVTRPGGEKVAVSQVSEPPASAGGQSRGPEVPPIILDWRRIAGHEQQSTISNVFLNGKAVPLSTNWPPANAGGSDFSDHLIFRDGVVAGENVIKLDFTSPILTSGSAITRYVDKEDGAEYIYSLFVPSDASTAFPVLDQPDLKARFSLSVRADGTIWNSKVISNELSVGRTIFGGTIEGQDVKPSVEYKFRETKPISTYVFAFAAGPWEQVSVPVVGGGGSNGIGAGASPPSGLQVAGSTSSDRGQSGPGLSQSNSITDSKEGGLAPALKASTSSDPGITGSVFVRKSQLAKYQPHAAEVFRLTREGIKYLETYFDYKFPFPKYDIVLIPEFPFGGMEHAGATFLRESSVIFPQEPTKSDYISRANLIFHETAHQWFGDTVTMKWFDDLWLKEGFAEFMAYKTLEHVMPDANAWKVFYERNKQAAYATDSTKGTTPIYQKIDNLSAAKSAYGNIVYRKAPSFLRQAEFYLGPDKFQTAVRAFLKKHEFANAGWEDLVKKFETASGKDLKEWAKNWVTTPGLPSIRFRLTLDSKPEGLIPVAKDEDEFALHLDFYPSAWSREDKDIRGKDPEQILQVRFMGDLASTYRTGVPWTSDRRDTYGGDTELIQLIARPSNTGLLVFPNYGDYGYGIFLLDDKSRDYVLKNIQNEKDPFLRSMMYGSLWDSVREGELDPKEYVELVVKNLGVQSASFSLSPPGAVRAEARTLNAESDETIVATLLGRVSTALNYYIPAPSYALANARASASRADVDDLRTRLEDVLIERMQNAPTLGQRITFYRAFLNIAASGNARDVLKRMLAQGGNLSGSEGAPRGISSTERTLPTGRVSASGADLPLRAKDKFDIVTRLIVLGDPDAEKLLADLEKAETSDDAKRYAYAAHAAFATKENREKFWNDFVNNKEISESWIEEAMGPFNSIRHDDLSLPYLQRALAELPNLKRSRKIFFVNGWLGAFIGGQRSEEALNIVNKFLADNPNLDNDLRLKILENVDLIERAVKIRKKFSH